VTWVTIVALVALAIALAGFSLLPGDLPAIS